MALFGWCLPDMDIEQHTNCTKEFEYGKPITCHCLCHVDMTLFTKEYNAKHNKVLTKPALKKKSATKPKAKPVAAKQASTKNTKVEEESWQSTSSMLTELVHTANLKSQQLMNEQQLN